MSPCSLLFLLPLFLSLTTTVAGPISTEFLYPNFSASYLHFVDNSGVFLLSPTSLFALSFFNPDESSHSSSQFYVSLLQYSSHTPVWSANPSSPLTSSAVFAFSSSGLSLSLPGASVVWSTPPLSAAAASLRLLDSGELLLLDSSNASLWSSFAHPTDTLLPNQNLLLGKSLFSGNYRFFLTKDDAFLQWSSSTSNSTFLSYWAISSDLRSTKDSNFPIASMAMNSTGLFLFASGGGNRTVLQLLFPPLSSTNEFRLAKLDSSGRLQILSYSPNSSSPNLNNLLFFPSGDCDLPFACKVLGVCSGGSNGSSCKCPVGFSTDSAGGCLPADGSVLFHSDSNSCDSGGPSSPIAYLNLGNGTGYFANRFSSPTSSGSDISVCRRLCSGNCSCLGFFYRNSSKSCFLLEQQLGSLFESNAEDSSSAIGYIKVVNPPSPPSPGSNTSIVAIAILVPLGSITVAVLLISFVGFRWWRRRERKKKNEIKLGQRSEREQEWYQEDQEISIPGLPTRFTFSDLEAATDNFNNQIGSGGFGSVYKGQLPDKTLVAVKKITNVGMQGKREFCTEIAVIGSIHHKNLVKLRGFCAEGTRRLLVLEFMSHGSLDRSIFGSGPVLSWADRFNVAVGAAHGLAYLHSGCEHKIIHCDVKPENILLDEHNGVKIGDFGFAKLLNPEQSCLFTTMRGTRGYLAPEWLTNTAISDKTDVYSFGMVLLEIVSGRRNWNNQESLDVYFPMIALEMHEKRTYEELVDPRLDKQVKREEVERMVKVALCCLHEEPAMRPSMVVVAGMLEGSMEVVDPSVDSLNFLRLYGRGFMQMKRGIGNVRTAGGGSKTTESDNMPSRSGWSTSLSYMSAQQLSGPR
ncbi:G-type lectin S-receptor-like serine/threonine-protein kinase At5g35370 [Typha angustifolia]|uniref:G-type lectin S-receptor-like serine/threonine-protein kinase At5g35370 n=1 Tax=Typha angustifolia TaxID=59011 RepID=UPI003C2BD18E